MNILIVIPGGVDSSGEVKIIPALLSLFKELSKQHNICILALYQDRKLTEYSIYNCQVISLPATGIRMTGASYRLAVQRLNHYYFKPDLIHSFWLGHTTLLSALLSKKFKTPLFSSVAGGEPVNITEIDYGGCQSLKSRWINKLSLKLANKTSCGSMFVQTLVRDRWKIEPEIIPLGIDTAYWQFKECASEPIEQWNILQLASINCVKNPWLMLEIVKLLRQRNFRFHLNWIGVDTLKGEIQKQAQQMGLIETISFHGFKTQSQLLNIIKKQHFIVQTSHYEAQGIAMAEACSQGVCPVGTDVGWISDLDFGLSHPGNVLADKIAEQIITLANNFTLRNARVMKAQDWIRQNDVAVTALKFTNNYVKLLRQ